MQSHKDTENLISAKKKISYLLVFPSHHPSHQLPLSELLSSFSRPV